MERFVPCQLVFHGDFAGGYHMIDSIPEECSMDYIRRYLEQVAGGVAIERIYNYHDQYETYDCADATTSVSTIFNLEEQVRFSVNFKEKPRMEKEADKPAAKASGRAEKVCKGIFGKAKAVETNALDGTFVPPESEEEGGDASTLKVSGSRRARGRCTKGASCSPSVPPGALKGEAQRRVAPFMEPAPGRTPKIPELGASR